MKILYINTFYAPQNIGGAENSLQILVESMQKKGHSVSVLATSNIKGLRHEMINDIKVYRVGVKKKYWLYVYSKHSKFDKILWHIRDIYNLSMSNYLNKVIFIEKPDIISIHNIRGWSISIWDIIKKSKIPIIQALHDFYLLCPKSMLFKDGKCCKKKRCIECRIMRILHRRKSEDIDAVVGVCQDILDRFIDAGYFKNSIKKAIHNVRIVSNIERKNIENKTSPIIFGFIGTLTPNKGVLWLIEQFKKVKSNEIFLKIAGKGKVSYENLLMDRAMSDSRISFLGYIKSEDFYSMIDVLIIPSVWHEPLASVAIEACAHHIPVITSAAGGLGEIIINENNGLYCSISNQDSISDAIYRIINDRELLNKLQNNAKKSILHFLDVNRLICEYEEIYNQIIK